MLSKTKEKIKICVVGCGRIGMTHIETVKKQPKNFTLFGVVDVNKSLVKKVAEKYKTRYFTSLKDALQVPEINAYILALPIHLHAKAAIDTANAGKHILLEKPMARDIKEVDKIIDSAEKNKVVLMIGQSLRYYNTIRKVKSIINSGKIGKVINLTFIYAIYASKETRPSWWKSQKKTAGLVYSMIGSHAVDFIQWIFEDRKVVYVFSSASSNFADFQGPDEANILIKFSDESSASCLLSLNTQPRVKQCLIIGDKGNIYFEFQWNPTGPVGKSPIHLHLNGQLIMREKISKNFDNQLNEFAKSIFNLQEPETSGKTVRSQIQILNAARLSSAKECPIYFIES